MNRKIFSILWLFLFSLYALSPTSSYGQNKKPIVVDKLKVKRIIDGDTIELTTGAKIGYIGINTPETKHPSKAIEEFGAEAAAANKKLVEGKD